MMETLTEKCKTYLEEKFLKKSPTKAQEFSTLRKVHPGYENISRDNRLLILERRALNLEKDLEQTMEDLENTNEDLKQAKEDLKQTKQDLKQTKKDLEQTKGGL